MPDLSIVIINWNTRQLLLDCVRSVYDTVRSATYEIFVVDNGSTDGSVEAVATEFPNVMVIANARNEGFARANNLALRRMQGSYAVLLNSDTVLKDGALDGMRSFMEAHPETGICGPQLLFGDGRKQTSYGTFPRLLSELVSASMMRFFGSRTKNGLLPEGEEPFPVDFIIGACMFVRKSAMDAAGMLDEDYFFFYEEIDWCWRMRRGGWTVMHLPGIQVIHFGGQSARHINLRARVESWRSRYLFFRKSLDLRGICRSGPFLLGLAQVSLQFLGYLLLNVLTLFLAGRLRRRWLMFGYLLLWHLRGMPISMGLPR